MTARQFFDLVAVLRKWLETIEWLDKNVWQFNEKIENITYKQRLHWWISGLNLEKLHAAPAFLEGRDRRRRTRQTDKGSI